MTKMPGEPHRNLRSRAIINSKEKVNLSSAQQTKPTASKQRPTTTATSISSKSSSVTTTAGSKRLSSSTRVSIVNTSRPQHTSAGHQTNNNKSATSSWASTIAAKQDSHPNSTLNSTNSTNPRISSNQRASIPINTSSIAANGRLSASLLSKPSPVGINKSLVDKISSIESRIKVIEDNCTQESRYIAIEAYNQLKAENKDLRQTFESLKGNFEGIQFVIAELIGLETKFNELEERSNRENTGLKNQISELSSQLVTVKSEIKDLRSEINELHNQQHRSRDEQVLVEKGISIEQQELNSNIVIRGVDLVDSSCDSKPLEVYNSLRNHLGIATNDAFEPVSVKVLQPKKSLGKTIINKTIQVRLRSSTTKRQFLQIRRIKKDILPTNIGLVQNSKKPILITEQLTKENQELLYAARSLRGTHKFKYVWSNNGQILTRPQENSKVLRIKDVNHVNDLRASIELNPLHFKNGRLCTNDAIESHPSN